MTEKTLLHCPKCKETYDISEAVKMTEETCANCGLTELKHKRRIDHRLLEIGKDGKICKKFKPQNIGFPNIDKKINKIKKGLKKF